MELKTIKGYFPPNNDRLMGEDIISPMMPENYGVYHIDSHDSSGPENTPTHFRFQGVITLASSEKNKNDATDDKRWVINEMPLSVLAKADSYQIIQNHDHIVWTIWFKK